MFRSSFVVFLLAGIFAVSHAEPQIETSAKPVVRTPPKYPASELNRGQQGWVKLSYVVTEDGDAVDPVVVDSSGSPAFERSARNVVKNWRFEPATQNGEAVQQCHNEVLISFAIEGNTTTVSRRFHTQYKRLKRAVDDGDFSRADELLAKARERRGLTMAEGAWLHLIEARIAGQRSDKDAQLAALRRATASQWLDESIRARALLVRTALELELGAYSSALDSHERLVEIAPEDLDLEAINRPIERLRKVVDSETPLTVKASIERDCDECDSHWKYRLLRRKLSIADIDGRLDAIELRCEWKRFSDQARPEVAWQIPESWGDCSVIVSGEPGARFTLIEESA